MGTKKGPNYAKTMSNKGKYVNQQSKERKQKQGERFNSKRE